MNKTRRYAMFALLYFAQGSIMSFFTALNALYLQSFGLDMSQVGIIGTIAMIPFILKIFLGMLSDKVNFFGLGHRKPYIIIGLIVQAVCLVIISTINPATNFAGYALLAFVLMTGMALYDTCTDGLALDTTPVEEEGIIQSFMVGGRAVGMVIVSAVLGVLVNRTSWTFGFYFLALATLLPLPLVLFTKESKRASDRIFDWSAFACFKNSNVIALAVLGALYSLIIYGANQIVNPSLAAKFGINYATAGFIATVLGIGTVLGSLAAGKLTEKIGQKRSVQVALIVSVIAIGLLTAITAPWMAWVLVFTFGLAFGFYETVFMAISMRVTDGRIAATMFSILMAVANIGTGIGLGLSGVLADSVGYNTTFLILAVLNVVAWPLINQIFKPGKEC
ncbi:MAG: transporter, family, beta-lactamase induction signal transducer AmpG [Chloroflexota bacterium]|nr:transporter, family, beta-lactamase induction signal transducer AmpG [Chloroflexota bacterium]